MTHKFLTDVSEAQQQIISGGSDYTFNSSYSSKRQANFQGSSNSNHQGSNSQSQGNVSEVTSYSKEWSGVGAPFLPTIGLWNVPYIF
ncbi:CTB family bacteriocin [Anabaena sp. CCY 9910]|uniref:CTB family bacteriocin n=1 Tax=Anabaena sp. CCY 9910 TaxID=3103870 RepID=UPI0039E1F5CC